MNGLKVIFHRLRLPSQEDLDDLRVGLQERGVTTVSPGDAFISKRRKHVMIATARRPASGEVDPEAENASDPPPPPYIVVEVLQTEGRNALDAWDWWNGLPAAQKGGIRFGPASDGNASGFIPYTARPAPKPKAPTTYPAFDFEATIVSPGNEPGQPTSPTSPAAINP